MTYELPSDGLVAQFDAVMFLTRAEIRQARELKAKNPDKPVILLTGVVEEGDEAGGVIPISKGDESDFEKIANILDALDHRAA